MSLCSTDFWVIIFKLYLVPSVIILVNKHAPFFVPLHRTRALINFSFQLSVQYIHVDFLVCFFFRRTFVEENLPFYSFLFVSFLKRCLRHDMCAQAGAFMAMRASKVLVTRHLRDVIRTRE